MNETELPLTPRIPQLKQGCGPDWMGQEAAERERVAEAAIGRALEPVLCLHPQEAGLLARPLQLGQTQSAD